MQKELLTLSRKELDRLGVMKMLQEKRLKQKWAAERLQLCVRQIRRIISRYRKQGPAGLASRKRGKSSNRRLPADFREQAMFHVKKIYHDFKPTFAQEKLLECHGIAVHGFTEARLRRGKVQHRCSLCHGPNLHAHGYTCRQHGERSLRESHARQYWSEGGVTGNGGRLLVAIID